MFRVSIDFAFLFPLVRGNCSTLQKTNTIRTMEEKAREKEEIRLALAKAYFESKIENTDDFFASLLLSSSSSSSDSSSLLKSNKNEILNLWRSALQEENEGGEKEKVDDDAMIRTALREVLEANLILKTTMPRGKRDRRRFLMMASKNSERNKNNGFASWSSLCENAKKTCKS